MAEDIYDVIIIGGGPAGLTAGIYTSRGRLKTLIIEKGAFGGQAALTHWIENFPGFPEGISGMDLSELMRQQAEKFGCAFEFDEVKEVLRDGDLFVVKGYSEWKGKTLIVASGRSPRKLGVPGESEFTGKGVSYCATCDGAFYRDMKVAVVGGGDSAVKESLFLTKFATKVYIIHRRDQFRAEKIISEEALSNPKIEPVWNTVVTSIEGKGKVESVKVKNVKTGESGEIEVDGVFVYIGNVPNTQFLQGLVDLDEAGYVIAGEDTVTSVPGVFAAGDVRRKVTHQVATAVGDGATAAVQVENYLSHGAGLKT